MTGKKLKQILYQIINSNGLRCLAYDFFAYNKKGKGLCDDCPIGCFKIPSTDHYYLLPEARAKRAEDLLNRIKKLEAIEKL